MDIGNIEKMITPTVPVTPVKNPFINSFIYDVGALTGAKTANSSVVLSKLTGATLGVIKFLNSNISGGILVIAGTEKYPSNKEFDISSTTYVDKFITSYFSKSKQGDNIYDFTTDSGTTNVIKVSNYWHIKSSN